MLASEPVGGRSRATELPCSFLGGPGEGYVESRGTKVSWRPHHTGDICTRRKNNG